ncbi:hypothetical protein TNIN_202811 [Trichonephila inaurata madagascariensis]|uniref:Uncharacterized protein n=1 Tax=Trichonephila inaurata madagascariensis TaxID=2747483 RepID=A0A8X7CJ33_9ARAC|nr:hypothetical protein TNIN_202811 [Trichonephila inaurata madagascariensis]
MITTKSTEQQVEELILADGRVTINSISAALGCSYCLVHSIIHNRLYFRKRTGPLGLPATNPETQKRIEWAFVFICLFTETTSWRQTICRRRRRST